MNRLPEHLQKLYPFHSQYISLTEGQEDNSQAPRIHYTDQGQGPVVLLLHGNPTWSFYYRNLIQALKDSYRVIAVDHIGCGLSDKPTDYPYNLRQHSENLGLLVRNLDLKDITLVVHDWGGPIGFHWLSQHPELVSRVVALNTAFCSLPFLPRMIKLCRLPFAGKVLVQRLNLFLLVALRLGISKISSLSAEVRSGYLFPYRRFVDRIAIRRFVEDIPLEENHPSRDSLAEISNGRERLQEIPLLILWGEKDPFFNWKYLKDFQQNFPSAEVKRFANAGHWILEDECDQVVAEIENFLRCNQIAANGRNYAARG